MGLRVSSLGPLAAVLVAALVPGPSGAAGAPGPSGAAGPGAPMCHPIGVRTGNALPVGSGTCPGVRPGGSLLTSKGLCTFNFLFTGSDRNRYIGTAGHCFLGDSPLAEDVGEKTYKWTKGPWANDGQGKLIGYAVYAVLKEPKDFALIRLLPSVKAYPSMCHFGGPTAGAPTKTVPALLHYYGNGTAIGEVLPARTAVATNLSSPDHVYAQGVVVPGDSGGGVIDDTGRAVGVIVTTGAHTSGLAAPTDDGAMGITRLQPQVARAAKLLRLRLTLRTAPLA